MLHKLGVIFLAICATTSLASDVLELGDNDFSTTVAEAETTLVMFYAPW